MTKIILTLIILFSISINHTNARSEEWHEECTLSKTVGNIKFTFPSSVDIEVRNHYIQNQSSITKECLVLINEESFTDSVEIVFFEDRSTMKKYLGWPASGMACPDRKVMFCILAEKISIKHEWMHMISMLKWGNTSSSLMWMNEGLATYADKCSKHSNEEIYTFFIQKNKLININNLVCNFHKQNEIIAYFQAAYLVEFLLTNYEVAKFKQLWQSDISEFDKIYGKSLIALTSEIQDKLVKKYSGPIALDWVEFEKGCY